MVAQGARQRGRRGASGDGVAPSERGRGRPSAVGASPTTASAVAAVAVRPRPRGYVSADGVDARVLPGRSVQEATLKVR